MKRSLYGLVLTGGRSQRMGEDKALIEYQGEPHALYIRNLLAKYCDEVYLSSREGQWRQTALDGLPTLVDRKEHEGPIAGMLAAFATHPDANWLIVATDLAYFNAETIETLLAEFDPESVATCFTNRERGFPEPLCTMYSPLAKSVFETAWANGQRGPVSVLKSARCRLLAQAGSINLANFNSPEDRHAANNQ